MPSVTLRALNTTQEPPSSYPFTLQIPPQTDLYRKPSTLSASQPTFYIPIKLGSFGSATVKVKKIPYVHVYDQAGVALLWANRPEKWIKAGVEFFEGELRRSTVAPGIEGWSDWNIAGPVDSTEDIVVSVEREKGVGKTALVITVDGKMVRKIQGLFVPQNENEEIYVGVYGARPAKVEETLNVEIADFVVVQV